VRDLDVSVFGISHRPIGKQGADGAIGDSGLLAIVAGERGVVPISNKWILWFWPDFSL
jgi:hypothetical protein